MSSTQHNRLFEVVLDEASIGRSTPDREHERAIAIYDLVDENSFTLLDAGGAPQHTGPYSLRLAIIENRIALEIRTQPGDAPIMTHILSLTPFRRIVRDYYMICESYFHAIKTATPSQIETIDMARRGLHNDGSDLLIERLNGKIQLDFDTARRLFTLIGVLYWKG